MKPRILIIGLVWPEPTSSAAGWRILQLIEQLQQLSDKIHFACAASKSAFSHPLSSLGVEEHDIVLNNASFDAFIEHLNPDIVVYDRFMIEEQYGWRVKQKCPNALTILDTEDLHFVRKARTKAFKTNTAVTYDTTECYREISAIYRCDLSLIISKWEQQLLIDFFKIPEQQLLYIPFLENDLSEHDTEKLPSFHNREHLMFIGNFIHDPNYQTVVQLKSIWKSIKQKLPQVQIHIYGAYPSQKILQLNNEKEGFIIKGKADDVNTTMQKYRLLVAPIPYGAGLKGKFIDGFKNGLPNITTTIGAESMFENSWGGKINDKLSNFTNDVYTLYTDEEEWNHCVQNGYRIINNQFSKKINQQRLLNSVLNTFLNIKKHRESLFIQKILWQNSLQATKYMSLWIEEKAK